MAGFLGGCVLAAGEEPAGWTGTEAFWERVLRAEVSTARGVRCSDLAFLYELSAGSSPGDLLRVLVEVLLDGEGALSPKGVVGLFTRVFGFLTAGFFFLLYLLGGAGEASTVLPSVDSSIGISCLGRPLRLLPNGAASALSSTILSSGGSTISSAAAKGEIFSINPTPLTACALGVGVTGLSPVELTVELTVGVFSRVVSKNSLSGMLAGLWLLTSGWNRLGAVETRVLRLLGNSSAGLILDLGLDLGPVFLVT